METQTKQKNIKEFRQQLERSDMLHRVLYNRIELFQDSQGGDKYEFCLNNKGLILDITNIVKSMGVKITYNALTNRNFHTLVKCLTHLKELKIDKERKHYLLGSNLM